MKNIEKNKMIRKEILKHLYEVFHENPHKLLGPNELINAIKQKIPDITDTDIYAAVKYLEGKGYLDVTWTLGGNFSSVRITSSGIDAIENDYL